MTIYFGSLSWNILNGLQNLYCYLLISMEVPSNLLYFLLLFQGTMFLLPKISLKLFDLIIKFNLLRLPKNFKFKIYHPFSWWIAF